MNVGTSNRFACNSIGFDEYSSVYDANVMCERILGPVKNPVLVGGFFYVISICLLL